MISLGDSKVDTNDKVFRLVCGCIIAILLVLSTATRLSLIDSSINPHFEADSWGYVHFAHNLLDGKGITEISREFFYPLFVYGVFDFIGGYSALGLIQLALSFIGILLVIQAWSFWKPAFPGPIGGRLHALLGIMLAITLLFHGGLAFWAIEIGPESLFISLNCLLLWLCSFATMRANSPRQSLTLFVAALFLAILLYFIRPHWALAGLGVGLLILAFIWMLRLPFWMKLAGIAASATLSPLLILLPSAQLSPPNRPDSANLFLPITLTC